MPAYLITQVTTDEPERLRPYLARHEAPSPPRIHVDEAARRTVPALEAPPGVLAIVDEL